MAVLVRWEPSTEGGWEEFRPIAGTDLAQARLLETVRFARSNLIHARTSFLTTRVEHGEATAAAEWAEWLSVDAVGSGAYSLIKTSCA